MKNCFKKAGILSLLFGIFLVHSAICSGENVPPYPPEKNKVDKANYDAAMAGWEILHGQWAIEHALWAECPCGKEPKEPQKPTGPRCIYLSIPFGTPLHRSSRTRGDILLQYERPTALIFSPSGLKYASCFDTNIAGATTANLPAGISSEVRLRSPEGYILKYQFKPSESTGSPSGRDIALKSKLRMIDANGNPVIANPAYYERLLTNGTKVRVPAAPGSNHGSILDEDGTEYTQAMLGVESIYNSGVLRQIYSKTDGLADLVVIDNYKYEIRLYAPENAGSKDTAGVYVPQGNPYEKWIVENPNRSDTDLNTVRFTRIIAGTTYVFDWKYTEATNSWTVVSGNGLKKSSKYYFGDYQTSDCQILEETRDAGNNLVRKKISNSKKLQWAPKIVSEVEDPDGAALTTSYTYHEDSAQTGKYGNIKTKRNPDGSWESYDYDSQGNVVLKVSSYKDAAFNSAAGSAKAEFYSYTPLDSADVFLENDARPRSIETTILGVAVNKKYFVYKKVQNELTIIEEEGLAAYGDSSNRRKTTTYYSNAAGSAEKGLVKSVAWSDGKLDSYSYENGTYSASPDPASSSFSAGNGDALRTTVIHGTSTNPAGVAGKTTKEVKVEDGRGDNVLSEVYAYDGAGYSRISWNVKTFDSEHHALASYNSNNTYSTATWNCCTKDSESTNDGIQYTYSYNLLRQMVSKTKVGGPTAAYAYDVEGRQLSETISGGSVSLTTSTTYDLAGRVTSRTDATGLTTSYAYANGGRTVTVTHPGGFTEITEKYLDGRIKSVTGTAVIPKYYTYGVNTDGSQWAKVCTAVENGPSYVKTTVDVFGRTVSEERPGATDTLVTAYIYDSKGLLVKTTSTGNADTLYAYDDFNNQIRSALDLNANGQIDLDSDDRVSESETSFVSDSGAYWLATTNKVYGDSGAVTTGVSRKKLTGLGSGVIAESRSIDINGNETVSTTTLDRTSKTVVQTVNTPDSNVDSVSTTVNGLLVSQRTSANLTYNFSYDGIGRKIGDSDPRTGSSSTVYNNKGQVASVTDAAGKQTSFTYETTTGRRSAVTNALNKATTYSYNSRGQIVTVRGDASYPLDYVYDSYGRMTQLLTYRDAGLANADVTTWNYQEATGLLTSKTYADNKSVAYTYSPDGKLATRTWSRGVVTNYAYNLAGDLTLIDYSDTTPDVGFTYNRLGQQLTVTDAVGSRTFGYNGTLQLTSETINGIYNKILTRSYDSLGRSSGMNIGTEYALGYGYDNLGRFSTVTSGTDVFTYGYLPNSNLVSSIQYPNTISVTKTYESNRDLVTSIENKYGNTTISKYEYSNDDLGRRTAMDKSGTAFTQADTISYGYDDRSEVTSAVAQNQQTYNYGFNFDPIGNRLTSASTETGSPVTRLYTSNNLNQYTAIDNPAATPSYDFDGNMTGDGSGWTYSWDAENRLIVAEKTGQRLDFKYDYMSRRVEKRVLDGGTETKKERFVYNGYLQIEQLSALNGNAIEKKRIWGAGNTIIADMRSNSTFYALGDDNKNITEYLDVAGTVQGHFEFSPFGEITLSSGNSPDSFDFRFSSENFDSETGLVYYNYRYYCPELGRWLNREPIGERGGENIYAYCFNWTINETDYLGKNIIKDGLEIITTVTGIPTTPTDVVSKGLENILDIEIPPTSVPGIMFWSIPLGPADIIKLYEYSLSSITITLLGTPTTDERSSYNQKIGTSCSPGTRIPFNFVTYETLVGPFHPTKIYLDHLSKGVTKFMGQVFERINVYYLKCICDTTDNQYKLSPDGSEEKPYRMPVGSAVGTYLPTGNQFTFDPNTGKMFPVK